MLRLKDTLGGQPIAFNYCESERDFPELWDFIARHSALGMDTESTHFNCYRPGWQLRSFQVGDANTAYIVPAEYKRLIGDIITMPLMTWIGHNGPHDIRSIDTWLGRDTGVICKGETYIPCHYTDNRKQEDGGIGHGLKESAIAYVSRDAGKWEYELKKAFKEITIPIAGEVYKSGKRKGLPKVRKAHISEGWGLIPKNHHSYVAYSGADPVLTYRLWARMQPIVRANLDLYHFDLRVQLAADKLHRRAMKVDVPYTERLSAAYENRAAAFMGQAAEYGCQNINSGQQVARVLIELGAELNERTPTGKFKTDDKVLRALVSSGNSAISDFIHAVLGAKQVLKRRENYTEAFLREMDSFGRVHPSINTLAARTTRMSVSNPPLQQLPTKDREDEASE